jgi:prepilin-type N-terminal cleavage/methylation domain-containing protein
MSNEPPPVRGRRRAMPLRPAGYTVIELVCALGIIAIFAAAGTPKFAAAIYARRADAAARRLAADIEWLRSTARTTSTSQSMTFNTSASSYSLTGFTNPDIPGTAYAVALADSTYKSQLTSVNIGGSGSVLTFNGYGLPAAAATIAVKSGKTSRTITVDGTTGAVTWQ